MADEGSLQQEVLQKTLQEVEHLNSDDSHPCVICLEQLSEPARATPCGHADFDFLCLTSWVEQRPTCPLCKSDVKSVLYGFGDQSGLKEYVVTTNAAEAVRPQNRAAPARQEAFPSIIALRERRRPRRSHRSATVPLLDDGVARRRYVYKHRLFSCRVGSNRMSQYRELKPQMFNTDAMLIQRARLWIRRELQVFSFLYPEAEGDIEAGSSGTATAATTTTASPVTRVAKPRSVRDRRSGNAEFLLEYIISILRTVDIKAASGAAEDLLQEFLGRDNARLFLHELHAFLRSPYSNLRDWDAAVQYDESTASKRQRQEEEDRALVARKQALDIYPDSYVPNYDENMEHRRRRRRR